MKLVFEDKYRKTYEFHDKGVGYLSVMLSKYDSGGVIQGPSGATIYLSPAMWRELQLLGRELPLSECTGGEG